MAELFLMTTQTSLIGQHEALFWQDGTLELQELSDEPEHVCGQMYLDEIEQMKLYMLLDAKFRVQKGA